MDWLLEHNVKYILNASHSNYFKYDDLFYYLDIDIEDSNDTNIIKVSYVYLFFTFSTLTEQILLYLKELQKVEFWFIVMLEKAGLQLWWLLI